MRKWFLALVAAGLLSAAAVTLLRPQFLSFGAPAAAKSEPSVPALDAAVNVLVLGVDERNGDTGRSDSMTLVRISPGQMRALSIPRDTLVDMGEFGEGKANSAYTYGGPELAMSVVSDLIGLPVDGYVKLNMEGFRELIDIMGGVEFDVPKPMHYYDPTDDFEIDLEPGQQVLDGDKAEQFVRFRYDESGEDTARIERQQQFLKAAASQVLAPKNLTKLPSLISTARSHVETNLSITQQLKLASALYAVQQTGTLDLQMLPGASDYVNDLSFYLVDEAAVAEMMRTWQE